MIIMSSVMNRQRLLIDPHVPHNLPAMNKSFIIRKVIKHPQRSGCLLSLISCSSFGVGVSGGIVNYVRKALIKIQCFSVCACYDVKSEILKSRTDRASLLSK